MHSILKQEMEQPLLDLTLEDSQTQYPDQSGKHNAIRYSIPQNSLTLLLLLIQSKLSFNFRIGIADKNDNPPYFDKHLYEAEVDENEDIQHTVLTVTANDKDECKFQNMERG